MPTEVIWGSIRKVLLDLASGFVEVNEDLESVTVSKAKESMKNGGDLWPRGYHYPEAEITFTCRATQVNGKVKLLSGSSATDTTSIEVTIRAPIVTRPLNMDDIDRISRKSEADIKAELKARGIEGVGGDYFIPDEE